jgi:flagellar basal-body rod modification protein FlgD
MTVGAVAKTGNSQGAGAAQSPAKSASETNLLNYDSFLQLFIAQLKNQDPTSPQDPSQQIAQLATFSQVEQTVQSNTKLDSLLSYSYLQSAQSYIGKYVEAPLDANGDPGPKGVVASVKTYSDGSIATLEDGKQVLLGPGVVVRNEAPTDAGEGDSDDEGPDDAERNDKV